jgi:hypothetical protein
MPETKTFLLKIRKFTPETIPMNRLAAYMKEFAILLGEFANVHFEGVAEGSAVLRAIAEFDAVPKINHRVRLVATGQAPPEAMRAIMALNELLANDNTSGSVAREDNSHEEEMISLPGAEQETEPVFGPISQPTTLDGIVIRVGGTLADVPVHIQTRDRIEKHCFATRELAKQLGKHLFETELRIYGDGKWIRDETGIWILQKLDITRFEELNSASLIEAVADLRSVEGHDWSGTDPWRDLSESRRDEDG